MKSFPAVFWTVVFCFALAGCTSIPDVGTRAYVIDRMNSVQIGNTPDQVRYILDGPPQDVTLISFGQDRYELWEYRIGNFLYAETAMILFRNNRVFALPKDGQELIKVLHSVGIIDQVQPAFLKN